MATVTLNALARHLCKLDIRWKNSLTQWFWEGGDTMGIVLIYVKGTKLNYWQKNKQVEVKITS